MDEIEEFKKFLGPVASNYTNAQLPQLRRELNAMAELLLDIYLAKRKKQRRAGLLTGADQKVTMDG